MRSIQTGAELLGMVGGAALCTDVLTAAADGSGAPHSKGIIQCEDAVIDAADLQSIYSYITEKKNATANLMPQLGTKFRLQSGEIIFDRNPDSGPGDVDVSQLDWPVLVQAAADSQKVPEGLNVLNPEDAMHIEGVEEYTDYYVAATADNISRGKAAWEDGKLLLGTGADNDKAYQTGFRDGGNNHVPELFHPLFSAGEMSARISHVHVGNQEDVEGISGCYKNSLGTKVHLEECGAELQETGTGWYPNPDEPGGGSWHGGEYTCPYHGGIYSSPGKCTHEDEVATSVWKHEVVCGLEGAVYARLTIRGADTDYTDDAIRLEAVLEQGSAYGRLAWRGGEQLVWTDGGGNTLGTGSELIVSTPGTYQCSINVSNSDIDKRAVSAAVRVSGLMLRN